MSEHLTLERLSAVLDEPQADSAAVEHLDACAVCQREYESMSRMRMALSGLAELAAPEGAWSRIEAALPPGEGASPVVEAAPVIELRSRGRPFGFLGSWPIQVAAAAVLFVGGLMVGERLRVGGMAEGPSVATTPPPAAVEGTRAASQASYEDALAELEELRLRTVSGGANASDDPAAAAERLIQLDALVAASREALQQAPEDPAVNDFLFQVIDERDALNAELSDVLRAATAEYR